VKGPTAGEQLRRYPMERAPGAGNQRFQSGRAVGQPGRAEHPALDQHLTRPQKQRRNIFRRQQVDAKRGQEAIEF